MENRSQEWIDQMSVKIREHFEIFDKEKTEMVQQEEVAAIMRALGVYPTERALVQDIFPQLEDESMPGMVPYRLFKPKMLQMLADKQWQPDNRDMILQAFRALDPQNKGYIPSEMIETYLTGHGTPFLPSELESFFLTARDPETGNIYYEDYVHLFPKDVF